MVIFPDIPVTVDLVEPQTLIISGVPVLLLFSVMSGLMSVGGSSAPLYVGVGAVTLVALAGVAVYFLRFRK